MKRGESARTCAEARDKFALCTPPVHRPEIERLPAVVKDKNASFRRCRSRFDPGEVHITDAGEVRVLAFLDLSAAFDMVYHAILLQRLQTTHHVTGNALQWFRSYLHGRYHSVLFAGETSAPVSVPPGVPQGSVLGPLLFILCMSDIPRIIAKDGLLCMCYAEDTQLYFHLKTQYAGGKSVVEGCNNHG